MIFSDAWTNGLTKRQQNLVIEYVHNECRIVKNMAGWKSTASAKSFLQSEKGRKAVRLYSEFFFDERKDALKARLTQIQLQRALFNPADIINTEGKLKLEEDEDLKKLGPLAFCIESIEAKIIGYNKISGKAIKEIKIKLCDRDKAIDFLVKAFDLFEKESKEPQFGEKSIFSMSDEERKEETKRLIENSGPELLDIIRDLQKKLITDNND